MTERKKYAPHEVKIETGIPMPGRFDNMEQQYPWAEMNIGDSFKVKIKDEAGISGRIYRAQKKFQPRKFEYRKMSDHVRVWRVA